MEFAPALAPSKPELSTHLQLSNVHLGIINRRLPTAISDLDLKDERYPQFPSGSQHIPEHFAVPSSSPPRHSSDSRVSRKLNRQADMADADLTDRQRTGSDRRPSTSKSQPANDENRVLHGSGNVGNHPLPQAPYRAVERYSLDDTEPPSKPGLSDMKLLNDDSFKSIQDSQTASQHRQTPSPSGPAGPRDIPPSLIPASSRQPSHLSGDPTNTSKLTTALPSGSASYGPTMGITIPISPTPRAYAQHPTFITPVAAAPNPVNTVLNPPPPPEEVCIECAMRDQDMADVVAVGPGVWERESDVLYEELVRREQEEEAAGIPPSDNPPRPRAKGGRLTEQNLKVFNDLNPREPAARAQTLNKYVTAQQTLLEAEALARARAMKESMLLDTKARDTYSQLRRSTYEVGNGGIPLEDNGPLRVKASRNVSGPSGYHLRSPSREVTLLENGLVVEHVDIRREEREEKERRRRQERQERSRARKSSRGSAVDVTSLYSVHSLVPHTDSGLALAPTRQQSTLSPVRPSSSLTAPFDRQSSISQAYSFSDAHSPGSSSPRRSRFFGFKNLSSAWRSSDSLAPSGMSGSMVDMHVALQRESQGPRLRSPLGEQVRSVSQRQSQLLPQVEYDDLTQSTANTSVKSKKKRKGLAKIWNLVKGSSNKEDPAATHNTSIRSQDREDDSPLAPPPPLSYLVNRNPTEHLGGARQGSSSSIPTTSSPRNPLSSAGVSPPTAPSSLLPSPTSSRPSGMDRDSVRAGTYPDERDFDAYDNSQALKGLQCMTSEPDIRLKHAEGAYPYHNGGLAVPKSSRSQVTLSREKSLPPLPGEVRSRRQNSSNDLRPQTLYTYDPLTREPEELVPPQAPFRADQRRQSFSGTASHPPFGAQSLPLGAGASLLRPGGMYNEFGLSRRSLGRLEYIEENPPANRAPSKRKSKFGLSSLLGKKSSTSPDTRHINGNHLEFPRINNISPTDVPDDCTMTGYTHSASRLSVGPRMSITSKKALEELVEQDREFVAYRYPSNDQRIDAVQ
ncbi:hypothetical protein CONPUDRAFT_81113 [Coniophora puteana RWD-64-598 SS2]|uniref:Uncharacterized protein n=1 Tax=Coniophora puteana (strain RWD-64-598) TaxID=741705 RepID=A0A5M3MVH9_CONPW|nr:uncharacterized protein CONPUDRAFT_81113 [Coniophora puteana RWD-64-598 SS2]EIW83017.1 hypothetical protein CONPUDRAFT_81113 [Coniophora puteana RWD-64-598 SS2]